MRAHAESQRRDGTGRANATTICRENLYTRARGTARGVYVCVCLYARARACLLASLCDHIKRKTKPQRTPWLPPAATPTGQSEIVSSTN